ncbi:hypothetical protein BH23GEM10_BH23GEM10_11340 [soil metagenome]
MRSNTPEGMGSRVLVAIGAAAGASALAWAAIRSVRRTRGAERRTVNEINELAELEESVVEALRVDAVTGSCAIDVAAVGPGIIELSGVVPTEEAAQRAARLMHAVPGVRTVINRLEEGSAEERLAQNRARRARGEPATLERHWTGLGVGTGRRRQSPSTDPDRPNDHIRDRTRALEVKPEEIAAAVSPQPAGGEHGVH